MLREQQKNAKYLEASKQVARNFVPLIVESYGRMPIGKIHKRIYEKHRKRLHQKTTIKRRFTIDSTITEQMVDSIILLLAERNTKFNSFKILFHFTI